MTVTTFLPVHPPCCAAAACYSGCVALSHTNPSSSRDLGYHDSLRCCLYLATAIRADSSIHSHDPRRSSFLYVIVFPCLRLVPFVCFVHSCSMLLQNYCLLLCFGDSHGHSPTLLGTDKSGNWRWVYTVCEKFLVGLTTATMNIDDVLTVELDH